MFTLQDVIEGIGGVIPEGCRAETVEMMGTVIDSRLASAGSLFVALRGEKADGHSFVDGAFAAGARLALVERQVEADAVHLDGAGPEAAELEAAIEAGRPICLIVPDTLSALQRLAAFWRARHDVRVVGITGSVGKTTTKEMVWAVLRQSFKTLRSEGNYNNEIGLPLTLLKLDSTYERVVLEMGMYDLGEIRLLAEIARPQVGLITNVGPIHLERLKTIERIAMAKAELVQALPAEGVAILNIDDPLVKAMADQTAAQVFFYGLQPEADLWASDIESRGLEGIRLKLHYRGETIHVRAPLLGRHSVHTVLRATAAGLVEGMAWEEIVAGLQDIAAHIRLIATPGPKGSTILDDTYNSSPTSAIAALNLLEELEGRRIAVLGGMLELGEYEEIGHRKVGRRAYDVTARLITVGSLARLIAEEALAVGMSPADVFCVDTNAEVVALLNDIVEAGDVILIKGSRGMKMEEIVAGLGRP